MTLLGSSMRRMVAFGAALGSIWLSQSAFAFEVQSLTEVKPKPTLEVELAPVVPLEPVRGLSDLLDDVQDSIHSDSVLEEGPLQGPDTLIVNGEEVQIRIEGSEELGRASVFINFNEVVCFRSSFNGQSPQERAETFAQKLLAYLEDGGAAKKILAAKNPDGQVVIRNFDDTFLIVDPETAIQAHHEDSASLARVWANNIRKALGVTEPVDTTAWLINSGWYQPTGQTQEGKASWYGPGFHGRRTADGSRFDMNALTAAHRHLPFGTMVRVLNKRNGKSVLVKINDRGPYAHGRIIDLSKGAAQALGMLGSGVAFVSIEVLEDNSPNLVEAQ